MSTFQDPLAGTPKAATRRQCGVDNASPLEKARTGIIYEENGLFGMRDTDGTELYPAKYYYIGRCRHHVLFLEPDGSYLKLSPGCRESGFMQKDELSYVKDGKVGFKVDRKILIPAEYDYIRSAFGDHTVFLVTKGGREYYINDKGKEVLTRVRTFDGEELDCEPFWLRTNEFDCFTVMNYVGHEVEDNPNVVQINGEWVELERYSREEILNMIINPQDDLPVSMKDTGKLCDRFSYEYSFYVANASGEKPLEECFKQFGKMGAFDNSWYYTFKLWQAPGEHVAAKALREFRHNLWRFGHGVIGSPVFAVGHDASLEPGEVRMLLVTHYYERCFPPRWEFDWFDKCEELSITDLSKEVPALKKTIDEDVFEEYREDTFRGLTAGCLSMLQYHEGSDWASTQKALEYFLALGSDIKEALLLYASNAHAASMAGQMEKTAFFLRAARWALNQGSKINATSDSKTPLDCVEGILGLGLDDDSQALAKKLRGELVEKGAVTYSERMANTDYFMELEYMRN